MKYKTLSLINSHIENYFIAALRVNCQSFRKQVECPIETHCKDWD